MSFRTSVAIGTRQQQRHTALCWVRVRKMDALDALGMEPDAMKSSHSVADVAASAALRRGRSSDLLCTPQAKRTRHRLAAKTPGDSVARASSDDGAALAIVPYDDELANASSADESKLPCPGCGRTRTSMCFYSGTVVTWGLADGRGRWCKDCFGCWRLMYSGRCTLMMFAVFL